VNVQENERGQGGDRVVVYRMDGSCEPVKGVVEMKRVVVYGELGSVKDRLCRCKRG
jgi:hypothetical protein